MRILLVEDEVEFAKAMRGALERDRFVADWVTSISLAREASRSQVHELVLLDRTLPDGDGLSLIPQLRVDNPGVPIIVLSARGELSDRVAGLDDGADDYLVKPFDLEEMLARIRAVQRRPNELAPDEIVVGDLVFDMAFGEARVHGTQLVLQRREVAVLTALIRRRGRVVLRESLEEAVYGFDDAIQSNTLDSHISRLRRKFSDAGAGVEIHTVRGVGYLLRAKD
ncbi:two-component system OmpR family response regulator [Sinorhizobium meliloti]|jgi:two-component system, OmpR family, response regulator|uniref:DNA-binding response regulator n=2 Tax=Rhizobium TaxID=379 RepID=A0A179BQR0_RHILE|nr:MULTISPECIES: response regulator transcription factor [Rhizobiaceae]TWA93939.1 winged helix family two component transcriptional regulator [Ensifer sp. SEMIA 134]TWB30124.1 winged helix family two component transcriptional regulator [Ensifer sp. SEMIA 135]AIM01349.1 transcriptional regulator [Sinorhizobium meliloti]ASP80328.1 DNA-binding response regulator [Sinorhizobium meliloti]ASQ01021.1 DNA-binding response regulator [Sinorhizobium meliloti]